MGTASSGGKQSTNGTGRRDASMDETLCSCHLSGRYSWHRAAAAGLNGPGRRVKLGGMRISKVRAEELWRPLNRCPPKFDSNSFPQVCLLFRETGHVAFVLLSYEQLHQAPLTVARCCLLPLGPTWEVNVWAQGSLCSAEQRQAGWSLDTHRECA